MTRGYSEIARVLAAQSVQHVKQKRGSMDDAFERIIIKIILEVKKDEKGNETSLTDLIITKYILLEMFAREINLI